MHNLDKRHPGRNRVQGDGRHRRHRRTVVMSLCRHASSCVVMSSHQQCAVSLCRHVSLCRYVVMSLCIIVPPCVVMSSRVVTCRHVSSCVVMCRYVVMSLCRHLACVEAASVGARLRGVRRLLVFLYCTEGLCPVACPHGAGLLLHLL